MKCRKILTVTVTFVVLLLFLSSCGITVNHSYYYTENSRTKWEKAQQQTVLNTQASNNLIVIR